MTSLILEGGSTVEVSATDVKGEVVVTLDGVSHAFTVSELALFRTLINMAEFEAKGSPATNSWAF